LNRGILDVRLAAVLFIFLLGSVSLISVNQRVEANRLINASCSSCSYSDVKVMNATVLEGEEKNKAVATALSSEDYKNVKKLFPESVYDPVRDNATAGIVNVELNGTTSEVSAVFVPFEAEAGLLAGIVFMTIKGHGMAIGVVVDLQSEAPLFAAMSMDGKAVEIPLRGSCSCSSCSSGVSPMVDQCGGDSDCWALFGPDYCCVDGQCYYCDCPTGSDLECWEKYGEDYCCVNRQCQYCPYPPPEGTCVEWDEGCYYNCYYGWCMPFVMTFCEWCIIFGEWDLLCKLICHIIGEIGCEEYCKRASCTLWG